MSSSRPQVVITGAGLVTCLGLDRTSTWHNVVQGRCGIGPITAIEQPLNPDKGGGQAPDLPVDFEPDQFRQNRYLKWALAEALRDAGLAESLGYSPERCGLVLGTTLHGMRSGGEFLRTDSLQGLGDFLAASTVQQVCQGLAVGGIALTTCSACSSALASVALGITLLQSGQVDLVIAGGYDTISEYVYAGFNSLRLVATGAQKPFAINREGMKVAEGYGVVVLERAQDAQRRKANLFGHDPGLW